MAFRKPKKQPQFADLIGILAQTKDTENPLYQTVQEIIKRLTQFQGVTVEELAKKLEQDDVPKFGIRYAVREIPMGVLDGVNTNFSLAAVPITGTEEVYLNGLLQDTRGIDYSINGAVITFLIPPVATDRILVTYQRI